MKQRVGIAQALLNDPELLIVDEPTAGLDPEERLRFRNLLSELGGDRIVILSTHIVSDVETCATSIALIAHGTLLIHDSPAVLLRAVEGQVWEWIVQSEELPAVRHSYPTSTTVHRGDGVHVRLLADRSPGSGAVRAAPTLEDAYLFWVSKDRVAGA
jgi:ABC-type multidrug transport system ATPase subunit